MTILFATYLRGAAQIAILALFVVEFKQCITLTNSRTNGGVANDQRSMAFADGTIIPKNDVENNHSLYSLNRSAEPTIVIAMASTNSSAPSSQMALHGRQTDTNNINTSILHTKQQAQKVNECPSGKTLKPQVYRLSNSTLLTLHIGKGGGGTVGARQRDLWGIRYAGFCHFNPCPSKTDEYKFVQVNIRDPVDRFVSSFYWRIKLLSETIKSQLELGLAPKKWHGGTKIYLTYKGDANLHAEALCGGNATQRVQAIHDLMFPIENNHARFSIADWIPRNMLNRTDALIPVVLEKGVADFAAQIDAAIRYVYNNGGFEGDPESFGHREEWVRWQDCKEAKRQGREGEAHFHSSGNHTGRRLSKLGEKCLVQYYAEDYKIMQELLDRGACKTDDCRIGLESILKRRLPLLQE